MYMVPVREPLFPLGSRKIRKKVPLQLRIDYHILVVCFRIYDLWINKSMVEIANAGTLRELTLRVRTLIFMLSLAIEWRESSGKYVPTLQSNIFVTGNVKINEQDKSIGTGSLYV